jgi:uncharacterized membrane protein YedE/YeeE
VKQLAVAAIAGVVFAVGLGLSGMTNPDKILGFLDVTGRWDPSLLLVMVGAIGVHLGPARWALRARRPLLASGFERPASTRVDRALVVGSALFGVGWGAVGYCPGPALVDLVAPSRPLLVFVAAMIGGTALFRYGLQARRQLQGPGGNSSEQPHVPSDLQHWTK